MGGGSVQGKQREESSRADGDWGARGSDAVQTYPMGSVSVCAKPTSTERDSRTDHPRMRRRGCRVTLDGGLY